MPTTRRKIEPNTEFQSLKVLRTRSRKSKADAKIANKETLAEEVVDSMYMNELTNSGKSNKKNTDDDYQMQSESPALNKRLRRMVDFEIILAKIL